MKAAVAQFATDLDKEANRRVALRAVKDAAGRGATLVVLPEASMCGFGTPRTDLSELAEPLDGPFVAALEAVASETETTVVAGTFEPVAGEHRVYNTLAIVGPDGLVGRYRKVHLYDALGWCESERVQAGQTDASNLPVVPLGDLTLGVITCYDLRFPESARRVVDRGATVLAVSAAWVAGDHKIDQWKVLLGARAIENSAYVVAAAQPTPEYSGCSRIVDPDGVVMAELGPDDGAGSTAIVAGELIGAQVERVRRALPVLSNRKFSVAGRADRASSAPSQAPG
ncbi:MAG: carbon-nitrogen hydrolase family protein [Actinomycetes bacterium]